MLGRDLRLRYYARFFDLNVSVMVMCLSLFAVLVSCQYEYETLQL